MKKITSFFLIAVSSFYFGYSQSIFTNPITDTNPSIDDPYNNGEVVDANITVSGIGRGIGIAANTATDRYNARNWDSPSLDLADYFEFTLTPNANYEIDFISFVYTGQSSTTGPTNIELRSSLDGYASTIGTTRVIAPPATYNATIDLSDGAYQNLTAATTFRIYAWNASASAGTFSINDFTFNGVVAAAPCNSTVTWDGTNWLPGNPDITTEAIINADYDTAFHGDFSACSITVNATYELTVSNDTYVEIQNDIVANGDINVRSKGSVIQNNDLGTVSGTGDISVTKKTSFLNNWYEYTYWSSPVQNETVGNAFSDAEPNRRFYFNAQNFEDAQAESNNDNNPVLGANDDIDDNGDDWTFANNATILAPGQGFATTHAESLFFGPPMSTLPYQFDYIFSGLFNNGVINVPIYRNDNTTTDNNWNFIGNPYPSAISVPSFLALNASVDSSVPGNPINGAIFLWSQNTAPSNTQNGNEIYNFAQADYAIINGVTSVKGGDEDTNGDGTVDALDDPNLTIPSGQGFFVAMSDTAPATNVGGDIWTTNVVFNNSIRVLDQNTQFYRSSNSSSLNTLKINLTSDNGVFNQIAVAYRDNATNDYDGMFFDAPRNLSSEASSILYSIIEGSDKKFAIQGRNTSSLNLDEIVPLGFYTGIEVPTIYTLSLANIEGAFLNENTIYIKDNLNNTIHNLTNSNYSFTSEAGDFNDRFEIVFTPEVLSINDTIINANELIITELHNGEVQIKVSEPHTIEHVEILDILGRQIYNFTGNTSVEVYNLSKLSNAAYVAKVTLSNGQVISKKAVKQR